VRKTLIRILVLAQALFLLGIGEPVHAAGLQIEILGTSKVNVKPGEVVSWRFRIQREKGINQTLSLLLIDPQGRNISIYKILPELSSPISEDLNLNLATDSQIYSGNYKVAEVCYLVPDSNKNCLFDPESWPKSIGLSKGSIQSDLSSLNFQVLDNGFAVATKLQVDSVNISKKSINPSESLNIDFGLTGTKEFEQISFGFLSPTGSQIQYSCRAATLTGCSFKRNIDASGYTVNFKVQTTSNWSSGSYQMNYITLASSSTASKLDSNFTNSDSRFWVDFWNIGSVNLARSDSEFLSKSRLVPSDLDFSIADQGNSTILPPTISNVRWEMSEYHSGSFIFLLVDVDGHGRNINSVYGQSFLGTLSGEGYATFPDQIPDQTSTYIDGKFSNNYPLQKVGTFRLGFYIPRNFQPGTYIPYNIVASSTPCEPKSLEEVLSWYTNPNNECFTQKQTTYYANGSVRNAFGSKVSDLASNAFVSILPALKMSLPSLKLKSNSVNSVTFQYFDSKDIECSFFSDTGLVEKIKPWDPQSQSGLTEIRVSRIKPNTIVELTTKCKDSISDYSESSVTLSKTDLPPPPVVPEIVLLKIAPTKLIFSYENNSENVYRFSSSSGEISNSELGKIEINKLNPSQSIILSVNVTDKYGQEKKKDFNFKSANLPPPPTVPILELINSTSSEVNLLFKASSDFEYSVTSTAGNVTLTESGNVVVKNMKPNQKIYIVLRVTDLYGQSMEKTFSFQSAKQIQKVTITCSKGTSVKKITGLKPTCPVGYKKKS
jgi:hypothetical protein